MEIWVADQQSQTQLNIIGVTREDLRSYLCVAKNSMGEMSRKIRLTGKYNEVTSTMSNVTSLHSVENTAPFTGQPHIDLNLLPDPATPPASSSAPSTTPGSFERYTFPHNGIYRHLKINKLQGVLKKDLYHENPLERKRTCRALCCDT